MVVIIGVARKSDKLENENNFMRINAPNEIIVATSATIGNTSFRISDKWP